MESSFKIGRVAGIEIGIHYTWLFAFALVAWSLAEGYFPQNYRGWGFTTYWLVGVIAALALFVSVLIHELSHSFMARARGQGVHSITLFIFGGVSNLKQESERAADEFLVAVVGPLTSFGLAAVFWLAERIVVVGRPGPAGALLGYLALINLSLGIFNLLPGFPLDGGRVLRSAVWALSGSMRRATSVASAVGQGIGFLMIFFGVSQLFAGNVLGGLWIAFIGWFLNNAAESTRQQQVLREDLRGVAVADLMDPTPPVGPPDLTVESFVFDQVLREGHRALVVTDGDRPLGIVSISDARKLPQESWATTSVSHIMTPAPLRSVAPATGLNDALQLLVEGTFNQVPVLDDGRLVGMLGRADLLRYLQLRETLHLRGPGLPPRKPAAQAAGGWVGR